MNTYELTVNGDQGSKLHLTTAYPNEIMRLLQLSGMAAQDPVVDVQPVVMEPTDTDCGCEDAHVMEQQAEYDYGHDGADDAIEFDIKSYKFSGKAELPERLTSARFGANALKSEMKEDADYATMKAAYEQFILESENEAGLMSPLTANHRDEFDHDPLSDEDPVTDGTHSPMSTIKIQDLPK
jgi:hypothetical protein